MLRLASAGGSAPGRSPGGRPARVLAGPLAVLGATGEHRRMLGHLRGLLGLELLLGALEPLAARDRVGQLRRKLIAARIAEPRVLGRVDRVGLGEDPVDLLADLLVGPVRRQPGVGAELGAVDGDRPDPDHPGLLAHREHLHEQFGERLSVALAKPADRGVVWGPVGRDHPERDVLQAAPLDLTRRALPDRVRVEHQRDHHARIVRRTATPIRPVLAIKRGQIKPLDDIEQIPRQMPRRQPLPHTRRHQEILLAITRQEALGHPGIL
jgi:hypothetical protein